MKNHFSLTAFRHVYTSAAAGLVRSLPDLRLAGAFPPEIGNLTGLIQLNLQNNSLGGPIPGTTNRPQIPNCSICIEVIDHKGRLDNLSSFTSYTNGDIEQKLDAER
jgi:hypothetical protein